MLISIMALAAAAASQKDIQAVGPGGVLKGTIAVVEKQSQPVVLIIPGSGPVDRDGNSPLGMRAATYKLLAEALSSRGISTVRIDKRGMFASASAGLDPNAVTIEAYAQDAQAWVESIRKNTGAKCVWLLGHSEGGLVTLVTGQGRNDICGIILVATAARPLGEVLKDQLRANPANSPLLPDAIAAIDALASKKRVGLETLPPTLAPLFRPEIQGFLMSAFALHPIDLIRRISLPILIVQGERDIQIGVGNATELKSAAPHAVLKLLPDTNHVLKRVSSDDRAANVSTYGDPDLPLAPGVADVIANFVINHPK